MMENFKQFMLGLIVIIVAYYVLEYLFGTFSPEICSATRICGEHQETALLIVFIIFSLIFGIIRGKKKQK